MNIINIKRIFYLFITLAIVGVLVTSCERENVSEKDTQQEFIIFEELAHLVPDNFDHQNEDHINALLAKVDGDIMESLRLSKIIVDYLEEIDLTTNHIEVFGEKIPTINVVESILTPSQFMELKTKVTNNITMRMSCLNCFTVGWYFCHPCFCITCPIKSCTSACSTNQECINGQCVTIPPSEPGCYCECLLENNWGYGGYTDFDIECNEDCSQFEGTGQGSYWVEYCIKRN